MFGTKKVATIVLAIRACLPLLLSIFLPRLVAHRSNCGVPCRGIAFTQKTIFLVCWSKDPSRATAALLAVAFFTTKKLDCLAQTVVLRIADSVLPACGPQTTKLQTTWVAGPGNPGFRGLQGFQGFRRSQEFLRVAVLARAKQCRLPALPVEFSPP